MNFTFENQGSSSFMIYELSETDVLDDIGLGMVSNNKIKGIIPVSFMQFNDRRELRFNISSRISLESLLSSIISRDKILSVFSSLCDTLIDAEQYLLEERLFMLDRSYIYADVSTGSSVLMYLPVLRDEQAPDLGKFFKELIFSVQSDASGNTDYVARIINELNKPGAFNLLAFRNVIYDLKRGGSALSNSGVDFRKQPAQTGIGQNTAYGRVQNEIPAGQTGNNSVSQQAAYSHVSVTNHQYEHDEVRLSNPGISYSTQPNNLNFGSYQVSSHQNDVGKPVSIQEESEKAYEKDEKKGFFGISFGGKDSKKKKEEEKKSGLGSLFTFGKEEKEENSSDIGFDLGFEIPNQDSGNGLASADDFFSREEKKNQKEELPADQDADFFGFAKNKDTFSAAPDPATVKKDPAPPVARPVAQKQYNSPPVYNNYSGFEGGGTTVLGNGSIMDGGTTMLNENMLNIQQGGYVPSAYLRRERTGEEVKIEGFVFHIGRERSFVNYFIGDNPAISKNHADVINRDGQYYIKDTNSKNRTYINGQLLTSNKEYVLSNGDTVMMADEKFEFKIK